MLKGIADGSFGIEVAKLAQLPSTIIHRSQEILDDLLSVDGAAHPVIKSSPVVQTDSRYDQLAEHYQQLSERYKSVQQKLKESDELLKQFSQIDYEQLSPKAAFDLLWKLKEQR